MAAAPEAGPVAQDPEFSHLQWLGHKDKQVLVRGECSHALREEAKLLQEIRDCILAHQRSIEFCRAASAADPDWYTVDVQACHRRKIDVLSCFLEQLQAEPPPEPEDAERDDSVRSRLVAGYAHSAQATGLLKEKLKADERVQHVAANVASALGTISENAGVQNVASNVTSWFGKVSQSVSRARGQSDSAGASPVTPGVGIAGQGYECATDPAVARQAAAASASAGYPPAAQPTQQPALGESPSAAIPAVPPVVTGKRNKNPPAEIVEAYLPMTSKQQAIPVVVASPVPAGADNAVSSSSVEDPAPAVVAPVVAAEPVQADPPAAEAAVEGAAAAVSAADAPAVVATLSKESAVTATDSASSLVGAFDQRGDTEDDHDNI